MQATALSFGNVQPKQLVSTTMLSQSLFHAQAVWAEFGQGGPSGSYVVDVTERLQRSPVVNLHVRDHGVPFTVAETVTAYVVLGRSGPFVIAQIVPG